MKIIILYYFINCFFNSKDSLIILKMFSECLLSLHLLILFLCFSFENHKRKIDTTLNIIYFQSLISPVAVFLNYFFNACISHNLYSTFFSFKSSFDKRIRAYKILAIVGSVIIFLFSLGLNNNMHMATIRYSFTYYSNSFLKCYYLFGLVYFVFIMYNIFYILIKKEEYYSMIKENILTNKKKEKRKDLIELFVKRHVLMLIVFTIAFLPNNLILIIQTFLDYRICEECNVYSIMIYFMSLSCTISFVLKMTEPYMLKYVYSIINFVLRKKQEVN